MTKNKFNLNERISFRTLTRTNDYHFGIIREIISNPKENLYLIESQEYSWGNIVRRESKIRRKGKL
jgi:hypothetical protein